MKTDHLNYGVEYSHLAEIGLIGIAEYNNENHYAMVVEGDRSSNNALLFFLAGECVISSIHQNILVLPNAFISPTLNTQTIKMSEPHGKPGSIVIEKSNISMIALKDRDWHYVSLLDGSITRQHANFKPYTQTWHLLCPDHSGVIEILYSFEANPPS